MSVSNSGTLEDQVTDPIEIEPESDIKIKNDSEGTESKKSKELKESLLACLDGNRAPGNDAFSKHHIVFINPGLMVADTLIPLPLVPRDVETIKRLSRQAPFGQGDEDETMVDISARKTWELDNTQFSLSNPMWQNYIKILYIDAIKQLGMPDVRLDLYKLLLYEEGSFSKPHKDSGKTPGMIGTLLICLPSKHQGGSVHLSRAGKEYVFDTDETSEFGLTSLVWFSDVTYETKPLVSGYRLVLTYNLIHVGGTRMSVGPVGEQSTRLRSILDKWRNEVWSTNKLVYLLEHKYTQSSLSLDTLKGRDKDVCQCLYEVGKNCQFTIFLAQLNRSRTWWGGVDEMVDLEELRTPDGLTICNGADIDGDDILQTDIWDRHPDSEERGKYTGNESMQTTQHYHDTVVIIMPMRSVKGFFTYNRPELNALMRFITGKIHDQPEDRDTRNSLVALLEATIKNRYSSLDGELLSNVVDMAIEIKNKALYKTAISASLRNKASQQLVFSTIVRHVDESFRKYPDMPPDWNLWLVYLTTELLKYPLSTVAETLSKLDSLVQQEYLMNSFQDWKRPIMERMIESKQSLGMDDVHVLIDLLLIKFDDLFWVAHRFTRVLAKRASKPLICAILHAISSIHEKQILPGAQDVFQCVLNGCTKALALQVEDLPKPDGSSTMPAWSPEQELQAPLPPTLEGFVNVVNRGFSIGLYQHTTALLNNSCTNIDRSLGPLKSCPIVAYCFLQNLISVLIKHNVAPLESVKQMYIALTRDVIVGTIPKQPIKRPG